MLEHYYQSANQLCTVLSHNSLEALQQALKKKSLVGASFLGEERHLQYHHLIQKIMDNYLENKQDRELFDLSTIHKDL